MDLQKRENDEIDAEINLRMIWKVVKKAFIPVLIISLLAGGITWGVKKVTFEPIYSSSSVFYVSNISTDSYLYSSSQISGAALMAECCTEFAVGNEFLNYLKEDFNENVTVEQLQRMITVKHVGDSAMFTVKVSGKVPENNYAVAKSIEKKLPFFCAYMNNQVTDENKKAVLDESLLPEDIALQIKINNSCALDQVPDNIDTLKKTPLLVFAATLILGLVAVFLFDYVRSKIYTESDLREQVSDHPVFGVIPRLPEAEEGKRSKDYQLTRQPVILVKENGNFLVNEAFHRLRTNVTFCADQSKQDGEEGKHGLAIGVVSARAESGKSFVMSNLANSLSKMIGKKVLLVDADMRCPMVHRVFQISNQNGLSNLLAGQIEENDALVHVSDSLDVLPAGTIPPNPIELLSSPNMNKFMNEWKKRYDYVLVDMPPLGEVSDALALKFVLSGYLFVLRSGRVNGRNVRSISAMLDEKKTKVFGYVLTDVRDKHSKSGAYYSKYHKYYGEYSKACANAEKETNAVEKEN